MNSLLVIVLTTLNPAIRRVFILYIGLKSIRSSLHLELQPLHKLIYFLDEIALMFFVPIVFQLLQHFFQNKVEKTTANNETIDNMQIIFSIFFYSLISLINGYLNFIILMIGYIAAYLCYLVIKALKKKKFYIKNGPTFFGFFIYIVSLVLVSAEFGFLTTEQLFLLIVLPRVAYGNIFNTLSRSKVK